jgi:hypothetical protein
MAQEPPQGWGQPPAPKVKKPVDTSKALILGFAGLGLVLLLVVAALSSSGTPSTSTSAPDATTPVVPVAQQNATTEASCRRIFLGENASELDIGNRIISEAVEIRGNPGNYTPEYVSLNNNTGQMLEDQFVKAYAEFCATNYPGSVPSTTTPPPTTEAPPTTEPPITEWTEGTYEVGQEIKPGTYKTPGGDNCYYARLSSDSTSDIIANNLSSGPMTVRVRKTDKYIQFSGSCTWRRAR